MTPLVSGDGPDGLAWAGSGLEATLRDFGRFALIATNGGRLNGRSIVPDGWFGEAGAPHSIGKQRVDYGYMWWIPPPTVVYVKPKTRVLQAL